MTETSSTTTGIPAEQTNPENNSDGAPVPELSSRANGQEGADVAGSSVDPPEPMKHHTTVDESQEEDPMKTAIPNKQIEEPVEQKLFGDANDNVEEKPEKKKESEPSAENSETEAKDDSKPTGVKQKKKKNSPSDEINPKKSSKSKSKSTEDKFETSHITDIRYQNDETDLLETLLDNATDKKLIDRLLGCAYGQALGDAYGLSTEFEERDEVALKYPDTSKLIPFPDYILTGHNRRWSRGDWTDDTDQWILILVTLMFHDGDEKVFARKLKDWILYGYPELGDHGGMGLGANVSQVVRSSNYIHNPLQASKDVWEYSNRQAAPNGAVMRCSASAFVHFRDRNEVISTAELMCKTTHFDPRCIASCLAVCLTITYLLNEEIADDGIEALVARVQQETIDILEDRFSEDDIKLFKWFTEKRTLEELNLDERGKIGYTYKCLASGFYGLRSEESFEKTLNDLIRYGGDADTNGAVCGTMYGARRGYRALPFEWLKVMPNKKWFDQIIIKCLEKMNLAGNEDMETNVPDEENEELE